MFDLDRIGGVSALDRLVDATLQAGEEALRWYRGSTRRDATTNQAGLPSGIQRKGDQSPVTEADRNAEKLLSNFIRREFPRASFFGEESGAREGSSEFRFFVDPIDGTRAFVRGIPTWSVLLGLEAAGEPVLGIAFMPAAGDLFVGVKGHCALVNGRPIHLSTVDCVDDALVTHGTLQQFRDAGEIELLARLANKTYTARGNPDFDGYRQLLLGRAEAMVDPGIKPYDVCPAAVLVREAGGRFTDFSGNDTIHGSCALATNGLVHSELLSLTRTSLLTPRD